MGTASLLSLDLYIFANRRFIVVNLEITDKIIILDLEATCWEDGGFFQKQRSEIIEIGLCVLDVDKQQVSGNFDKEYYSKNAIKQINHYEDNQLDYITYYLSHDENLNNNAEPLFPTAPNI